MFEHDVTQSSLVKNGHGSIDAERGALAHSVPHDIVEISQRQRILDGMAECCAEKTYAATTIADIVSRAGVSRRTFYKIFTNKRECFEAGINAFADELGETVASLESKDEPWPNTVRRAISKILDLLASKPAYAYLVLVDAIGVDPVLLNRYWEPLIEAMSKPRGDSPPPSAASIRAAVGTGQVLVGRQVIAGRGAQLHDLLPDLVYIGLAPIVGQEEALEQARLAH